MLLFLVAFVAGALTVFAPCILPMLPVVLSGSAKDIQKITKPLTIIAALCVSVVAFTLLLKASTAFISVPPQFWQSVSGVIITLFGLTMLFPRLWTWCVARLGIGQRAGAQLATGSARDDIWGDVLIGASLGPIFSSCSPTYAVIVAIILPESFATGMLYLLAYVLGLAVMLMLIAVLGQRLLQKFFTTSSHTQIFKRIVGAVLIVLGIAIIGGYEKNFEAWLVSNGVYDSFGALEARLLELVE